MIPHWRRVLTAVVVVLLVGTAASANNQGGISGSVRDTKGVPLAGALVVVAGAEATAPQRMAISDKLGRFSISNLLAGDYSVKVTLPRFLPVTRTGLRIDGGTAILTINLQTALDIVQRTAGRDKAQAEDIVWTMRSSPSTRPILRMAEDQIQERSGDKADTDYSGYVQVFSKSVEMTDGSAESVGSQFSVTVPLAVNSQVTLVGQYSETPGQPRGFGALYEFAPRDRQRSSLAVNMRQGALFSMGAYDATASREVNVEYGEDLQWSKHLVFNYGAEVGRADAARARNYLRPRFGVSWVPEARTTISGLVTTQAPLTSDDPVRGNGYFDRTAYIPPSLERYSHSEVKVSHVLADGAQISAAVFRDRIDTQALFLDSSSGRRAVVIFNSSRNPSLGLRLHLDRQFQGFEAGVGYTYASGLTLAASPVSAERLRDQLVRKNIHVVTARMKADVDLTQTEITAVYRWMSSFSASHLDPYQRFAEYHDPTLSIAIVQDLPTVRMIPGKLQAILDARNLFEQSFGPHRMQFAQSPRLLKGGINLKF